MNLVELGFSLVKILVVLLFLLNSAAIATWADRRQSAMVQDRVGPNRAVVYLPAWVVRLIVFMPGLLLGGGALGSIWFGVSERMAIQRAALDGQLAVLTAWASITILGFYVRRKGAINAFEERVAAADPRNVFYTGLVGHAFAMVSIQMIPQEAAVVASQTARAVLALGLVSSGFFGAACAPRG